MATCRYVCTVCMHKKKTQKPPEHTLEHVKPQNFLGARPQTPLAQPILRAPLFVFALGPSHPLSSPDKAKSLLACLLGAEHASSYRCCMAYQLHLTILRMSCAWILAGSSIMFFLWIRVSPSYSNYASDSNATDGSTGCDGSCVMVAASWNRMFSLEPSWWCNATIAAWLFECCWTGDIHRHCFYSEQMSLLATPTVTIFCLVNDHAVWVPAQCLVGLKFLRLSRMTQQHQHMAYMPTNLHKNLFWLLQFSCLSPWLAHIIYKLSLPCNSKRFTTYFWDNMYIPVLRDYINIIDTKLFCMLQILPT